MDDVFNTPIPKDEGQGETQQTELQQTEQQQPGEQQQGEQGAAPPAAQDTTKHVPLEALEAERKGRQDWKEKAIRYEEELRQIREQQQRAQQGQQQQQDPLQQMHQQIVNERFNTSEMLMRERHADVDEVVETFKEAAAQNPALIAQMHASPHPWKFAYEEGKRMRFAAEIGNDPEAYRKKVREEVLAELQKSQAGQPAAAAPAAAPLPQSLAGARSAGARGNTWTGPTPMETLFPN